MDEFDLDLNDDMSTPISQLKNKSNLEKQNFNTYENSNDMITPDLMPILNNNFDTKRNTIINMMTKEQKQSQKYKKNKRINQPINNFIRDLENNLDNFTVVSNKKVEPKVNTPRVSINEDKNEYIPNIELNSGCIIHREIFISMLLFMIINNKIIIELIYNYIPSFQRMESPYPNLLLRTIIFGLILYLIKKFKL
jgi:hypothetical protein